MVRSSIQVRYYSCTYTQQDRAPAVEVPDRPCPIPIRSQGTSPTSISCARVDQTSPTAFPTSLYVAQELPKRPWPGTGPPWRVSGPLNRRLGLFGCSSAAESGLLGLDACLPTRHCLPSACHCLLSATVILSQNSPIPIWQSWIPTPGRLNWAFFWARLGFGVSTVVSLCLYVSSYSTTLAFYEHVLPATSRARTPTTTSARRLATPRLSTA